jgi:ATP-dependent exoDNAse (exonuclease V) beta subunit
MAALRGWQIVDFKTDSLRSAAEREAAVEQYRPQLRRYAQAALDLLREPARVRLCFLDGEGRISLQEMR